jgi:cytoskeletal protein CcmA (bactofilin family)
MGNDQNPLPASGSGPAPNITFIGKTIRINGAVTSGEDVHLNGDLEGQIKVEGCLTIGATGKANADINAREVIVVGSAKGNVETINRLLLRAGANLEGDVKTPRIVIEDGAYFKGRIETVQPRSSSNTA